MLIDNTYYAYNVARADLNHIIDRFSYVNAPIYTQSGVMSTSLCITDKVELKCAITMKCKNIFVKVGQKV